MMLNELTLVNLTQHTITLVVEGETIVVQPTGIEVRVSQEVVPTEVTGLYRTTLGTVENMPEPVEGTLYIVSSMVLSALRDVRSDVYAPLTAPGWAIRNDAGQIIAVPGLVR